MIHVETLQNTPAGVRAFLALPKRLYRKDPYWVPPMRRLEFHHLFGVHNPWRNGPHSLFVAYDDERPVARVLPAWTSALTSVCKKARLYCAFRERKQHGVRRAGLDAPFTT